MNNRFCTRCRRKRPHVRAYDVRGYDGDRRPVRAELCPPCVKLTKRGKGIVQPVVHSVSAPVDDLFTDPHVARPGEERWETKARLHAEQQTANKGSEPWTE